jgi:diguanylate cyclase (GGDEF)-like protein
MPDPLALLIVEDSAAERALVDATLAEHPDIERRMADSLAAAQRAIDDHPPDVVLLDLELPDARGLDGVAWLQRRNPTVPVVVFSGFGADDLMVATEAVGMGAQDFLGKNRLVADELVRAIHLARARKRREVEALAHALRDPLTGLPRPALLEERVLRSLARSRRLGRLLAVLHLDVDGFAALADAVGSERADDCLVQVARRLAGELRRTDMLARLDGATFLVVIDGMKHASDAYVVARRLLAAMRRPFACDPAAGEAGRGFAPSPLRLSIGVAQWCRATEPEVSDGAAFAAQLARAESAMYAARRQGGDRYAATPDLVAAAG